MDVKSYVDAIERNANNAWQCANDLAYLLQKDEKLRTDAATAGRLSKIVAARVKSGPPQADDEKQILQEVGVRVFLCKALGEFATPAAFGSKRICQNTELAEKNAAFMPALIAELSWPSARPRQDARRPRPHGQRIAGRRARVGA